MDGRNDESQGDLASVAAIPDTERKRPSVPADGFSLMEKWKSPLHPLSEGAWRFSYQKNWGTSNEPCCTVPKWVLKNKLNAMWRHRGDLRFAAEVPSPRRR